MTDLRTRLLAEIERREQIAQAAIDDDDLVEGLDGEPLTVANPGLGRWHANAFVGNDWSVESPVSLIVDSTDEPAAVHIAEHDPADALRRYSHYRQMLAQHGPYNTSRRIACGWCWDRRWNEDWTWPCPDVRNLADALGIPIEEPTDA